MEPVLRAGHPRQDAPAGPPMKPGSDPSVGRPPPAAEVPFSGPIRVEHLFLSPGHNYFGHHGQPAGTHSIVEVEAIECVAGRGIRGDRFFDYRPEYKGQITFFSMEVLEALREALHLPAALPQATRRNVMVRGIDLNRWVGIEFAVQGVRFVGVEECRPCDWMNAALGPGAEAWLRGRGGLRCRILSDGWLRREG